MCFISAIQNLTPIGLTPFKITVHTSFFYRIELMTALFCNFFPKSSHGKQICFSLHVLKINCTHSGKSSQTNRNLSKFILFDNGSLSAFASGLVSHFFHKFVIRKIFPVRKQIIIPSTCLLKRTSF